MENKTVHTLNIERVINNKGKKPKPIEYHINDKTGCYECISHSRNEKGYITMSINNRSVKLHKFLYESCIGEIPHGFIVMHICDNPTCVNIDHYTIGTIRDNNVDSYEKGRRNQKDNVRLTIEEKTKLFLERSSHTRKQLAEKYGIGLSTVGDILKAFNEGKLQPSESV
jgi:hypothetical protein